MPDDKDLKKPDRTAKQPSPALMNNLVMPALAVFTGLVFGGIIIALANADAIAAWGHFFQAPGAAFKASWDSVYLAYSALFGGALGKPSDIIAGFQTYFATGQPKALYTALYPITESSDGCHALYLCRARSCIGLPLWTFQYRRRRSVLHGRPRLRICWLHRHRPALVHSLAFGLAGWGCSWSHLGGDPGLSEGPLRRG